MQPTITADANWQLIGHEWAVDYLRRSLRQGRQRHAYLFTGAASVGKMTLALRFAMALNCQASLSDRPCFRCQSCRQVLGQRHAYVCRVLDDVKMRECRAADVTSRPCGKCPSCREKSSDRLKIDHIRPLLRRLRLLPNNARYHIAIFDQFHLVQREAQDALLKTFEEPSAHTVLIIVSDAPSAILPTIRSRAQVLALRPVPVPSIQAALEQRAVAPERAELLARLSNGRVGWALDALQERSSLLDHWLSAQEQLREVLAGSRLQRLQKADAIGKISWASAAGGETAAGERVRQRRSLYTILEIWQTYWRDVLLQAYGQEQALCNQNCLPEIRAQAQQIGAAGALRSLQATRRAMHSIDPSSNRNANPRLVLDALFLDYPGLAPAT